MSGIRMEPVNQGGSKPKSQKTDANPLNPPAPAKPDAATVETVNAAPETMSATETGGMFSPALEASIIRLVDTVNNGIKPFLEAAADAARAERAALDAKASMWRAVGGAVGDLMQLPLFRGLLTSGVHLGGGPRPE